jgi:signal transduction histidine kinase
MEASEVATSPTPPPATPAATTPAAPTQPAVVVQRVLLGVRDGGAGLDAAARAALYDDFAQADGSITRATDGLGLGLPFVRRVAALFDLRLVVHSEPGDGAFFGLEMPLAPRPVPQRPSRQRAPEQPSTPVPSRGTSAG